MSHRGGNVSLLHQDVSRTVVDVLEAVGTQQNTSVPARHDHHDITHVQDLQWEMSTCEMSVNSKELSMRQI